MTDALKHATYLEGFYVSEDVWAGTARKIAATLRSQHAEIESLHRQVAALQRAAIAAQPGWVLVPLEPDEHWCYRVVRHHQPHLDVNCKAWGKQMFTMLHWHAAIVALAAAPDAPQSHPQR